MPSGPLQVVIVRVADDCSKIAHLDEQKCTAYVLILFPCWTPAHTLALGDNKTFDIQKHIYNCISPLSAPEKMMLWDSHFLDTWFVPIVGQNDRKTILMICDTAKPFIESTVENNEELSDDEANLLGQYARILKLVPKTMTPAMLLNDSFWDNVIDVIEFCSQDTSNCMRFRKVSAALQDHAEVQATLVDINKSLNNREQLEVPLLQLTNMISILTDPDAKRQREIDGKAGVLNLTAELFSQSAAALRNMRIMQMHLGDVFLTCLDTVAKQEMCDVVNVLMSFLGDDENDDTTGHECTLSKEQLNSAQNMIAECSVVWPISGPFEEAKMAVATAIRSLTAAQDLEVFSRAIAAVLDLNVEDTQVAMESATHLIEKATMVNLAKIVDSTKPKFLGSHNHGILYKPMFVQLHCTPHRFTDTTSSSHRVNNGRRVLSYPIVQCLGACPLP